MNGKEVWRDIEGFVGIYQVSNLGKVRGVRRFIYNKLIGNAVPVDMG